jgi:hypothetical protein
MEPVVKGELHQQLIKCNSEVLLSELKEILIAGTSIDWWNELTGKDKNLLIESVQQYNQGKFVSNSELVKQFEKWKKK